MQWRLRSGVGVCRYAESFDCLLNWQWWLGAVAAAFVGVSLPGHFFKGLPSGTVSHQVWVVIFKVAGAYLLPVAAWVVLLAWAAVLLAPRKPGYNEDRDDEANVLAPVGSGPLRADSVKLPLPESDDDAGGNA